MAITSGDPLVVGVAEQRQDLALQEVEERGAVAGVLGRVVVVDLPEMAQPLAPS